MAVFEPRSLGKGGAKVSPLGVGTNRWRQGTNDGAVKETWGALLDGGGGFIDTAEVYGFGKSEALIGDCIRADPRPVTVASKFAPFIARTSPAHLHRALDRSLARLGLAALDLYYIHFPFPYADLDRLADAMAEAVKARKVRHVGVSNFGAGRMRRFADRLARAGVPLAANEVNYSLANRKAETRGVLDACRELDVALVAYFPLASGRLTGAAAAGQDASPLRQALGKVAQDRGVSVSQVALNWLLRRDDHIIPIPGASKARHAQDNLATLEWALTDAEFAAIDVASEPAG
jgi:aryl-alcohol dehydrogenase-like predicted oxidoreductase